MDATDVMRITGKYRIQITEAEYCIDCLRNWEAEQGNCIYCGSSQAAMRIVGETDETNVVTNLGFNEYLVSTLGAIAGSKQVSHVALGTGGAPAAAATTLTGEITDRTNSRSGVTSATSSSSKTVRFTATFASSDSRFTTTHNISNIGLFQQSNTNTATLFAGAAYTSSSLATNQNVNVTYDIIFS